MTHDDHEIDRATAEARFGPPDEPLDPHTLGELWMEFEEARERELQSVAPVPALLEALETRACAGDDTALPWET